MAERTPSDEMAALWLAVFGEPAPIKASAAVLAKHLVANLGDVPPYRPVAPLKSRPWSTGRARRDAGRGEAGSQIEGLSGFRDGLGGQEFVDKTFNLPGLPRYAAPDVDHIKVWRPDSVERIDIAAAILLTQ